MSIGHCEIRTCGGNINLSLATDYPVAFLRKIDSEEDHPYFWRIGNPDPRERTSLAFCRRCHEQLLGQRLFMYLAEGNTMARIPVRGVQPDV